MFQCNVYILLFKDIDRQIYNGKQKEGRDELHEGDQRWRGLGVSHQTTGLIRDIHLYKGHCSGLYKGHCSGLRRDIVQVFIREIVQVS